MRLSQCPGGGVNTYKDAVEGAIIKQHRLLQLQLVRLVIPRRQNLIPGARTERKQLFPRNAVRRGHQAQETRADEPPFLLPTHLIAFSGAAEQSPRFVPCQVSGE